MAFRPKFDAVIFDLDGVITNTAQVHAAAWKKMFDQYLRTREERFGEPFREFTHAGDYLPYVDGKPRYKGVESFLQSRGIEIPFGDPSDDPEQETLCGLGNRKNILFNEVLDEEGVMVYDTSVGMLHSLQDAGVRIGVASSSKNCKPVLEKAGLLHFFETRVDGVVSAEIGLKGKPEPDIFITACDNLGVEYHRSVVVEDAVSGVQAGKKGNFGLVLGVAREENTRELLVGGADIVVEDLGDISLEEINRWFEKGIEADGWKLTYYDYDQVKERSREALLTVGNGYFGTRGALEESIPNEVNYPGTYISGLFNRLVSRVGDRNIENEDFVNITNWLPISFSIDDGALFAFHPEPASRIREITRTLQCNSGELHRDLLLEDEMGRITRVVSSRFASMHDPHRAGIRYRITPVNYQGRIRVCSELKAPWQNSGVERYSMLNQKHLKTVSGRIEGREMELVVKTTQSDVLIATRARHTVSPEMSVVEETVDENRGITRQIFEIQAREGVEIGLEKLVSIYTARDPGVDDPVARCASTLAKISGYSAELEHSARSWKKLWEEMDVRIEGDREAQRLTRLHLFHMMVSASPHHAGLDAGIPPRGLHGEAYRGHIFWDELYMLPLYIFHFPEVARSVLMYRYRRLDAARAYAREFEYQGAMFPWQSGSDGREETQVIHLNPLSGEWGPDYSSLQRHISLAIAYNIIQYHHITGDMDFMENYGAEILLDICKFWVSKSKLDKADGRYHIDRVMGPDEFHEKLPGSEEGGLTDNAYSNIMVSWMLGKALNLLDEMGLGSRGKVLDRLSLDSSHLDHWEKVMHLLSLRISEEGIVEQFRGYFGLKELDWEHYRAKYGDIHRLDRILKAEGKSPDAYKLSKQADFLMCFYNLGEEEVTRIILQLGYEVPGDYMKRNFTYYIQRTSHGSTLSRLVHARLAWQTGLTETGWELYMESLRSDLVDIQGGTTGEGIHCGVMAGTVCDVLFSFAGLDLRKDAPFFDPRLPHHWKRLAFGVSFRGDHYHVSLMPEEIKISAKSSGKQKIIIHLCGEEHKLPNNEAVSLKYT